MGVKTDPNKNYRGCPKATRRTRLPPMVSRVYKPNIPFPLDIYTDKADLMEEKAPETKEKRLQTSLRKLPKIEDPWRIFFHAQWKVWNFKTLSAIHEFI